MNHVTYLWNKIKDYEIWKNFRNKFRTKINC